jgi:nucleoside-diphosphate-sugar epimerase
MTARALVTGSAGFVGRHMATALRRAGCLEQVHVDIADGADCRDYFAAADDEWFDVVVHCAAVVGGRATIDGRPLHLAAEDLSIDAALFGWALRARPGRIVYFSSAAAYPTWMQHQDYRMLLTEDCIAPGISGAPDNTYGWVKLTGERLAAEANAAGIRTHVFRPFSGYGGDQSLDYPFPSLVRRAVQRQAPFHIWGDGQSARDWVHIDDVVGAVLAAIDGDVLGPVNICTGVATTFDELAGLCMDAAGYRAAVEYDVDAPQGVFWRVGDPARLHEFYRPKIDIAEGVARAVLASRAAA